MRKYLTIFLGWAMCLSVHSFGQNNSSWTTSGNIGIGTNSPQALFHVNQFNSLTSTSGDLKEIARFSGSVNTSSSQLRLQLRRWSAGSDWTTTSSRIQWVTDFTNRGYLEFQPVNAVEGFAVGSGSVEYFRVHTGGNFGIGTQNPGAKLHVNGTGLFSGTLSTTGDVFVGGMHSTVGAGQSLYFGSSPSNGDRVSFTRYNLNTDQTELRLGIGDEGQREDAFLIGINTVSTGWVPKFKFSTDGVLSIGTTSVSNGFKLFVEEGIRTRKVVVDQSTWADFVFHPTYQLRPLSEVKSFIQKYRHLPDVPSEEVIKQEGQNLGDMNKILLQKIEELTLYIIELKEEVEELKKNQKN